MAGKTQNDYLTPEGKDNIIAEIEELMHDIPADVAVAIVMVGTYRMFAKIQAAQGFAVDAQYTNWAEAFLLCMGIDGVYEPKNVRVRGKEH